MSLKRQKKSRDGHSLWPLHGLNNENETPVAFKASNKKKKRDGTIASNRISERDVDEKSHERLGDDLMNGSDPMKDLARLPRG